MSNYASLKPEQSELGKKSDYDTQYNPDKLFPIPRQRNRDSLNIKAAALPFYGYDCWNHYEVSWLNAKGKPVAAVAQIIYDCRSVSIIESKSFKLYFNSFNNTHFDNVSIVENTVKQDLDARLDGSAAIVKITPVAEFKEEPLLSQLSGISIDELDISCDTYHTQPDFLSVEDKIVEETLQTDLLKSNCLVTNQPDWCSVQIHYKGKKINREGLLRYIVSFRNDNEFHEQCIEKIFVHLMAHCQPEELTVYGRSTRRGGLDINSYRSTKPVDVNTISNARLCRQ